MKIFLLFFLCMSFLHSQELELDTLLKEYENSEELYLKSKKESAGHVIVYSRADLDKMQAYSLNDILKTLRMYNLQITPNGMTTLVKAGASQMSLSPVKIYINKHELNSVTLGNALTQYGKMSLYFIDHIEIYQASNSVTLGNEPANTVIQLYTKDPSRENGTSTQISLDSRGSVNLRAVNARAIGDYSYLVNVDASKNNFDTYEYNNKELSRDGMRGQFYFNFLKAESYYIEVGASNEKYDMLKGLGDSPTDGSIGTTNGYVQATKYFGKNLSTTLSLSNEKLTISSQDDLAINLFNGTQSLDVQSLVRTRIYDFMIDGKFLKGNHDISLGVQYKHQEFILDEFTSDGVDVSVDLEKGPKHKSMYIAYIEDLYALNKNNLLSLSAKINTTIDDNSKTSTNHILRIGYVSTISDNLRLKLFAIKGYTNPTFRQTTFSPNYNINVDLESSRTRTTTAEFIYSINNTIFTIGGGNSESKSAIVFSPTQKMYVNATKKGYMSRFYVNIEYDFDIKNKIIVDFFKMYAKNNYSPIHGLLIKSFNKFGKFDIYNELVVRSSYTSVDGVYIGEGQNYSLGVIYPLSKKMELKVKAENILDKDTSTPVGDTKVHAMDRRGMITVEYTF